MPIPSLPAEIKELMTLAVVWEKFEGFDGHAEPAYANPVELACWLEPHGTDTVGVRVYRRQDGTTVEPQYTMYFTGDNPQVRGMSVYDRFTIPSIDAEDKPLEALNVSTFGGPPFDNRNPWLVAVTL